MLQNVLRRSRFPTAGCSSASPYVCIFCQTDSQKLFRRISTKTSSSKPRKDDQSPPGKAPSTSSLLELLRNDLKGRKDEVTAKDQKKDKEPHKKLPFKGKLKPGTHMKTKKQTGAPGISGLSLNAALQQRGSIVREEVKGLNPDDQILKPIPVTGQPQVPRLSHYLDRVLFNPGVYHLQDPRSRVYNFDPYLQRLMPVTEFDFDAIASYVTSSKDQKLVNMGKELKKKYVGSTSSMTSVLSHFHYLLSAWRGINTDMLSRSFNVDNNQFTQLSRAPTAIFLRHKGDGTYAIDADKEFDTDSVLSLLGRAMEKLLTLPAQKYEKYRRANSHVLEPEDKITPETYHYSTLGDFLMRSQLDAYDPRLPGTGMFDLKTRAVVSVRMDVLNFHLGSGYHIKGPLGQWESFEREYYDMIRAAFLKYSLQVRMGRMDGIFVAFHNTEKIFGFQYVSLDEMDAALHEGPGSGIGEKEFKLSLQLFNVLLNKATEKYPNQSLRLHFETRETQTPYMYVFAEPVSEEEIERIQQGAKQDMSDFMTSLEEKLSSIEQTAELEEVAQKFGKIEEEPVEISVKNVEEPLPKEAPSEDGIEGKEDKVHEQFSQEIVVEDTISASSNASKVENGIVANMENLDSAANEMPDKKEEDLEEGIREVVVTKEQDPDLKPVDEMKEQLDEKFLDELEEKSKGANAGDLLALTLTIRNYVNGKSVLRPTFLGPDDRWEVEYSIGEAKTQARAWSTYNALKERRRKTVGTRLVSEDGEQISQYVKHLRELSARGRLWAKKQAALHDGEAVLFRSNSGDMH
ncbi:hypothetical protein RUND412_009548 [Rhizina undulata]